MVKSAFPTTQIFHIFSISWAPWEWLRPEGAAARRAASRGLWEPGGHFGGEMAVTFFFSEQTQRKPMKSICLMQSNENVEYVSLMLACFSDS